VPVLLLHGTRTRRWFRDAVDYVVRHTNGVEVREVEGAGHFGPVFAAEAVAHELAGFFSSV
jgi:pimeloyl-ACP methyl ester carboxylesterase